MKQLTGGKGTYKGINAQSWAAMSLFLQFVSKGDFRYIGFEGDKLEDFYLVFEDGHKIICESKAKKVGYPEIRDILGKVLKHGQLTSNDELLIVCEQVDKNARGEIENFKYFGELSKEKLIKHKKFTERHLSIFQQLKFWEVSQDITLKTVKLLTARLLGIWIPSHSLDEIVANIVVQEVYFGSQKGNILTKDDFLRKLGERKTQIVKDSGYDKERIEKEKHLKDIIDALDDPSRLNWANNQISVLSSEPDTLYFVLKKLEQKDSIKLSEWDALWKAGSQVIYSIDVLNIFKKNITSPDNRKYFLGFVDQLLNGTTNFFRETFIKTDIVDICAKILELTRDHDDEILEVIIKLYKPTISKFFYLKYREDESWERKEISKLLLTLYQKTNRNSLKQKIIQYIFETFNLVEDSGEYWHYTPPQILDIVKVHFEDSLTNLRKILIPLFSKQYGDFYKGFGKKISFDGWELMGGGVSQSGAQFTIHDHHFVSKIITPILRKHYSDNPNKTWRFILKHCVTRKETEVSFTKPDFLNRAVIDILLEEYSKGSQKKEAFEILSDFIRMRKGIPHKTELIFQRAKSLEDDEDKWALVEVSLKAYKNLPVNVFVNQIASDLASKNHPKALAAIAEWVENPEYSVRHIIGSYGIIDNIFKLLGNPETFDKGAEILRKHLKSKDFIEKIDTFDTYDVAKALAKVISEKRDAGLEILEDIYRSTKLTVNQQIAITSSIEDLPKDNGELLVWVFDHFVKPKLQELGSVKDIEKRFYYTNAREQFVHFADKLSEANKLDEALWLIKLFINDSDPPRDGSNDPDDKKGEFNEHRRIVEGEDMFSLRTIRGYSGWVLRRFCLLRGRKYIAKEILPLVQKLTRDGNYYVRLQATFPLEELTRNRHTVLPDRPDERFLPLATAEKIERLAFEMLEDKNNQQLPAVMKHLVHVFSNMRSLDDRRAYKALRIFATDSYPEISKKPKKHNNTSPFASVISEAAPLFIFFAEFRKNAFKGKGLENVFGSKLWKKISQFDDKKFKELLIGLLENNDPNIKAAFAWQFARLPNENKGSETYSKELFKIAYKYLILLTKKYEHSVFDDIYRFIEDYIEYEFEKCYQLWTACIETESKFFKENFTKDKLQEMYWYPFHYNGRILLVIAKNKGNKEFLKWLRILTEYPKDMLIAYDLQDAVDYLKSLPTGEVEVEAIFDRLIERDSKFYDSKQEWLKRSG